MSAATGEFAFIDWLRRLTPPDRRVPVGPGDDAAVVNLQFGAALLITTDMLLEGSHFDLRHRGLEAVGRKALAVNLSDIAAMAGRPLAAVVSVGLPEAFRMEQAHELYRGISELAEEFDTAVVGGDTNSWSGPLAIAVTMIGEPTFSGPVLRRGARAGDIVIVTGSFGGSLAGKHLSFTPRVREALVLHERYRLHAMIDVSDGLSADLNHLVEESGCGAVLRAAAIPIAPEARAAADGRTALEHALGDGEDFELVMAVPPDDAHRMLDERPVQVALTAIGEFVAEPGLYLEEPGGGRRRIEPQGYVHKFGRPAVGPMTSEPLSPAGARPQACVFEAQSEEDTERLGMFLAEALAPPAVVALVGPLGAGKTRLVRAMARGVGVDPREVASPTFVLIHEYRGRVPLYHFDAYRLAGGTQFGELGVEEYFQGEGISVIEWADRVRESLPAERLEIAIEVTGPLSRRFSLKACASRYESVVREVARW